MNKLTNILCVFLSLWFVVTAAAQNRGGAPTLQPADAAFYAVSYVEVMPASRGAAVAALKQYRDASRKDAGYVSLDVLEQAGRPAHFVVLEKWDDQKTFDAHGMAAHSKQLLMQLDSMRLGSYDQRPYRTLSGGSPASGNERGVVLVSHVDFAGPQVDSPALLKQFAGDSRKDEGNLRFDVLQHAMRANHFTIVQVWRNEKAFDAHAAAAHTRQFRDTIAPVLGSPLDERLLKIVE